MNNVLVVLNSQGAYLCREKPNRNLVSKSGKLIFVHI